MQEIERSTEIVTQINCFLLWAARNKPFNNFLSISLFCLIIVFQLNCLR